MDKYYVPKISEFHVGFECERYWTGSVISIKGQKVFDDTEKTTGWHKVVVRKNFKDTEEGWEYTDFHDIIYDIEDSDVRVKYLDREDIESFKFKKKDAIGYVNEYNLTSVVSKAWGARGGMIRLKTIYTIIHFDDHITISEECGEIGDNLFKGICKNKSQLKQLLTWIAILKPNDNM